MRRWMLLCAILLSIASSARASFHLWKFEQVFSNSDGSQQFIVMFNFSDGEQYFNTDHGGPFGPAQLIAGLNTFTFPNDLPLPDVIGHDTSNRRVLLATSGFNPGGLVPDFTLPASFFSSADTLKFVPNNPDLLLDSISLAQLPSNGNALFQSGGTPSTGTPAPANFTGESVSAIPLPAAVWAGLVGLGMTGFARRFLQTRSRE